MVKCVLGAKLPQAEYHQMKLCPRNYRFGLSSTVTVSSLQLLTLSCACLLSLQMLGTVKVLDKAGMML